MSTITEPEHADAARALVTEVALAARSAQRALAGATRATKDAALEAMADELVARTQEVLAANAVDHSRE